MATGNDATSLESALTRLDRMVGIGVASNAKLTATHERAHSVRGGGNLLAEIAAPLVRSATSGLLSDIGGDPVGNSGATPDSGASGTSGFNPSSGQSMAQLASAILRANKRYL